MKMHGKKGMKRKKTQHNLIRGESESHKRSTLLRHWLYVGIVINAVKSQHCFLRTLFFLISIFKHLHAPVFLFFQHGF